ncbi:High mobility group b protein [Thalictrum thalictroides]|uniref:High mobility group b protein n=1 Tax=Thalictrum thalictroides TaxID=46969 RepID=A0A7J6V6Z4_THATH|nr:High mobility group b protein [Thalictrum thalictroides]
MTSSSEETITEMPLENGVVEDLVSHQNFVNNPKLFHDTLKSFHFVMGTRVITPVIGGKELDLHVLYAEVTSRGGFQKVVEDKKWREISTVFNLPSTATSASYVLRKHYMSNLHHFEQVYFFKQKSPAVELLAKPISCIPATPEQQELQNGGSKHFTVEGKIYGKVEYGYLVTVKIGSEILHGVLYHPAIIDSSSSSAPAINTTVYAPHNSASLSNRTKKKRQRLEDPARPKRYRSAYNFFFSDKRSELKTLCPHRERDFTKMIGEAWNNLTGEEKKVYQEIGTRDKERYQKELIDYKEGKEVENANRRPKDLS